jgi:hypothetical protein
MTMPVVIELSRNGNPVRTSPRGGAPADRACGPWAASRPLGRASLLRHTCPLIVSFTGGRSSPSDSTTSGGTSKQRNSHGTHAHPDIFHRDAIVERKWVRPAAESV